MLLLLVYMTAEVVSLEQNRPLYSKVLPAALCRLVGLHISQIRTELAGSRLNPSRATLYDVVHGWSGRKGRMDRVGMEGFEFQDGTLTYAGNLYEQRCSSCPIAECNIRRELGSKSRITREGEQANTQIVFLPGISMSSEITFGNVTRELSNMGNDCGFTHITYPAEQFVEEEFYKELNKELASKKGNVIFVGTSFGAGLAVKWCLDNPELAKKVSNLVLFGPVYDIDKSIKKVARNGKDPREGLLTRFASFVAENGDVAEKRCRLIFDTFGQDRLYQYSFTDYQALRRSELLNRIQGFKARLHAFVERDINNLKGKITIPTKILWTSEDFELYGEEKRTQLEGLFEILETSIIEGQHSFVATNAALIAQAISAVC
ncbi:alpha/beta hydrolase [Candidatus Dojkabacteria bacterium]|nr:alpha/beta hydrolase [Candidatus Dojkabacteria bacterium]